jgi:hypothetical protein
VVREAYYRKYRDAVHLASASRLGGTVSDCAALPEPNRSMSRVVTHGRIPMEATYPTPLPFAFGLARQLCVP